jgi:hypothetical protein
MPILGGSLDLEPREKVREKPKRNRIITKMNIHVKKNVRAQVTRVQSGDRGGDQDTG